MKSIRYIFDLDSALSWMIFNKGLSFIKGPITLLGVMFFLTIEEQGIWFTFLSLGALTVFAELGFTSIVSNFVSHEYSNLKFYNGFIRGRRENVNKLFDLIKYALTFYLLVIPIAIIVMWSVGWFIFDNYSGDVFTIWLVYSILGGMQLFITLLYAIINGFDKIALIQKIIFIGSFISPFIIIISLYLDFGILSLVFANFSSLLVTIFFFHKKTKKIWVQLKRKKNIKKYSWFSEIIVLQFKYSISYISGYFISHFLIPMIFKYKGAVLAGQFGMTYSIIAVILTISMTWLEVKIPKMNILVAKDLKNELDKNFLKSFKISIIVFFIGSIVLFFVIFLFNYYKTDYADRFVTLNILIFMILAYSPNIIMDYLGKYTRIHKAEPLYVVSITIAILYFILISFLSFEWFTMIYLLFGMLVINWFIALPFAVFIVSRFLKNYYGNKNEI